MKKSLGWVLIVFLSAGAYGFDVPPTFSISDIQQGLGVQEGDRVRVLGITTYETGRLGNFNTVINDPAGGLWSGIIVYDALERLNAVRSDTVEIVGIVQDYIGCTQINVSNETEFPPLVTGSGTLPDPLQATCAQAITEPYESCIIMFLNVQVISDPDQYGHVLLSDGTGDYWIRLRLTDPVPPVGTVYNCLTGLNHYFWDKWMIFPRDEQDWYCPDTTPTPTATSEMTPTPTPVTECSDTGTELWMPSHHFVPGNTCGCKVTVCNPAGQISSGSPLFVMLDILGYYYFAPSFSEFDSYLDEYPVFNIGKTEIEVISEFNWPQGAGHVEDAIWYAVITDPEITSITGAMATWEFSWSE